MNRSILGIELRNVEFENEHFGLMYVDKDDILFYYPNADLSNDSKFFNFACDYLENYGKNVVSCDQAKINEVYLSQS